MKKLYEKPTVEYIEFAIDDKILDIGDFSEGVGEGEGIYDD